MDAGSLGSGGREAPQSKNVYVGNLAPETSAEAVRAVFEKSGCAVAKVSLVRKPRTGRSRGFAFVEMKETEDVEPAIESVQGEVIDGRPIKVGPGKDRPDVRLRPEAKFGRRGGGRRG